MRERSRVLLAAGLVACSAAACSGGGGGVTDAPARAPAPGLTTFTVRIPSAAGDRAAGTRRAAYVSANTQSVAVAVTTGTAALPPVVANVTGTSSNCTTDASGTRCTVIVPAPVGNDTFAITLYAGTNATGAVLATGTASAAIAGNASNAVSVSLGGVVATIAVALPAAPAQGGTPTTLPVTVTAKDASGATIVGNVPYAAPIALSDSDTSGATALSTATLTSPASAAVLAYTGSYVAAPVAISASASGVAAGAVTPAAFRNVATHLYVGDHASPNVYVFAGNQSGTATPGVLQSANASTLPNSVVGGLALDTAGDLFVLYNLATLTASLPSEIAVFAPGALGSAVTPARTIGGTLTLLDAASSDIAVDGGGAVYVDGSATNTVLVFAAGASGSVAPARQLGVNASGLAVSSAGTLVTSASGTIAAYAPGAAGSQPPLASTAASSRGIVALDGAGNVYTVTQPALTLAEYALGGSAFAPVKTIALGGLTSPAPVAVDQAGFIYVADETSGGAILVFDPQASGAATPVRTIRSTNTGWIPALLAAGR